ncbi:MAG: lactose/L-arabinose transport system substrate-binding protein [Petroclostridium sp.]|jgi:ABC-type glycerol-3-phosphate transport system substrate-binding protein|nr:hypothetical protein [Clostridia bacterium]MDK2809605.1 lactose/L-arabinose transport system substrate-binding protein [Petroclostridium sp.]
MRKPISATLIIALAISVVLVGDWKNKGVDTSSRKEITINESVKQVEGDTPENIEGEITVWIWENAKKVLDGLQGDFRKAYPNLTIAYETMPNEDLYKKFILAVQAGEGGPDVFAVESRNMPQMIKTQGLMDLTDRLGEDINKINKHKVKLATGPDGKVYAVPWDSGPVALFYNRKIFKEAGLPSEPEEVSKLINTWKDYYEIMEHIKKNTGAFAIAESKTKANPALFEIILSQKAESENIWIFDKEGNVKLDSPQGISVARFLTSLFDQNLVYDAYRESPPFYTAIKQDKIASIINAAWFNPLLKKAYGEDRNGNWGVIPLPVWDETDARTAESGGSNLAISKQTQNAEGAWAYVQFHILNDSSQLHQYKYGFFPSWEPVYGNPEVSKADPFFGYQNERKLFENTAKNIVQVNYTEDYPKARFIVSRALELCYNDKSKPVEEHLKAAADELRKMTGRK